MISDHTEPHNAYSLVAQDNSSIPEPYDSGASQHLSPCHKQFLNFTMILARPIRGADNGMFNATGKGDLLIFLPNGNTHSRIILKDVLYMPTMGVTLVSISHLTQAGCKAIFDEDSCQIFDPHGKLLGQVDVTNSLYCTQNNYSDPMVAVASGDKELTMGDLHACLSHIGTATIREMVSKGMITGVKLCTDSSMGQCPFCKYGKATHKPIGTTCEPA